MIDAVLYSLIQAQGWKKESFTTSGSFTAKTTGLHFIRATGGGGGGHSSGGGGSSGAACDMFPVYLSVGDSVSISIGAAGAVGGTGGTTSFGAHISLPGGEAGPPNAATNVSKGGLRSFKTAAAALAIGTSPDAISIGNIITGASVFADGSGVYFYGNSAFPASGHAGGYFGSSGANSGAGGNTNSVGYSGYLEVLWQE